MAELNPLRIEDFPEVTDLLSTDQVVLFTEKSGDLVPYLVEISAFGEYVLSVGELELLEEKVTELENYYKQIELEYTRTYMTPEQVEAEYSTITNFDTQIGKLEKTEKFKERLTSKATNDYLNSKYELLVANAQAMKKWLGSFDNGDGKYEGKGYKLVMVAKALGEEE